MPQATSLQLGLNIDLQRRTFIDNFSPQSKAKPFLKWVGGKTQLLAQLSSMMPANLTGKYFEPFLGSGALFFHTSPSDAVINDYNQELINCYRAIRDNVDELIEALSDFENSEENYYRIRSQKTHELSLVKQAARTIYLNRTCFNGLYRVNQKGEFNTPYGRYANPKICNERNLRTVSSALKDVLIMSGDYYHSLKSARRGDFIYFDPPYLPVSKYSDFKRYTKDSFYDKDHVRLAEIFRELDSRGCFVMLSNSDHPLVHSLFKGYNISIVRAKRLINKIASKRGEVNELIVRNYE